MKVWFPPTVCGRCIISIYFFNETGAPKKSDIQNKREKVLKYSSLRV